MATNRTDTAKKKKGSIAPGHVYTEVNDLEDGFIRSGKGRAENLVPEGDEGADFLSRATESGNDHDGYLKDIDEDTL